MLRLLMIDRDSDTSDRCGTILRNSGYEVTVAASGREGLALARSQAFDVVIADLRLPDMSWRDLLNQLQAIQTCASAIIATGLAALDVSMEQLGIYDYLEKPVNGTQLLSTVEKALSARPRSGNAADRADDHLSQRSSSRCPRVLLMAANRVLREGLKAAFVADGRFEVVGSIEAAHCLAKLVQNVGANAVVMDLAPRQYETARTVRELATGCPATKVVVLDVVETESDFVALIEAGAAGLLLKNATAEKVVRTVRFVLTGAKALPQALTNPLFSVMVARAVDASRAEWHESERITKREREIIDLMTEGLSNKEIASRLNIATFTVKSHVHNILEKLALQTRVQVVRRYAQKINGSTAGRLPFER